MKTRYLTIKENSETRFEIEKSIFISRIARVESEDEAQAFINHIKSIERDATHNCSAYVVGENARYQKADDDGEPSGTAGRPILDVIKRSGITDCAIVVTRYFGGIKLGAGGLVRAYSTAAKEAIDSAAIIERILYTPFRFRIEYPLLKSIETGFGKSGFIIREKNFSDQIEIVAIAKDGNEDIFRTLISNITSGRVNPEELKKVYIDTPL